MKAKHTYFILILSLFVNVYFLFTFVFQYDQQPVAETEPEMPQEERETADTSVLHQSGESYPLMRIIDGDTIVVGFNGVTQYVRLIGINAPEPNDPGGPQCYAEEATAHLQEITTSGIVVLHFDESQGVRDTYGRLLAYVELPSGTDLGKQMIEDGYAREFTYDTPYQRQALYQEAENSAIEKERGLWSEEACN